MLLFSANFGDAPLYPILLFFFFSFFNLLFLLLRVWYTILMPFFYFMLMKTSTVRKHCRYLTAFLVSSPRENPTGYSGRIRTQDPCIWALSIPETISTPLEYAAFTSAISTLAGTYLPLGHVGDEKQNQLSFLPKDTSARTGIRTLTQPSELQFNALNHSP